VEAKSKGGQGSRRAVAPSDDDDELLPSKVNRNPAWKSRCYFTAQKHCVNNS
jgi:hypothetical protein